MDTIEESLLTDLSGLPVSALTLNKYPRVLPKIRRQLVNTSPPLSKLPLFYPSSSSSSPSSSSSSPTSSSSRDFIHATARPLNRRQFVNLFTGHVVVHDRRHVFTSITP